MFRCSFCSLPIVLWNVTELKSVGAVQVIPVTRVSNECGEVQVWYSREIEPCPPCRGTHRPWAVGGPPPVGECVRHCSRSTHQGGALFTAPEWWVSAWGLLVQWRVNRVLKSICESAWYLCSGRDRDVEKTGENVYIFWGKILGTLSLNMVVVWGAEPG